MYQWDYFMAKSKILILLLMIVSTVLFSWMLINRNFWHMPCRNFNEAMLRVNGEPLLEIAIARTDGEKAKGLSGCEYIPRGKGMFFVFDELAQPAFWMKDMLVPIDMVWIKDKVVVSVLNDVLPPVSDQADLTLYHSPGLINAVLEVAAGEADRLVIREGTLIQLEEK